MIVAASAIGMQMSADETALFVLTREPRALVRVDAATLKVDYKITLPDEPVEFALAPDDKTAAVTLTTAFRLVDAWPSRTLHRSRGGAG